MPPTTELSTAGVGAFSTVSARRVMIALDLSSSIFFGFFGFLVGSGCAPPAEVSGSILLVTIVPSGGSFASVSSISSEVNTEIKASKVFATASASPDARVSSKTSSASSTLISSFAFSSVIWTLTSTQTRFW